MDGSPEMPPKGQVILEPSEMEASSEISQKEGQVLGNPLQRDVSSGTHQQEIGVVCALAKVEESSDSPKKEGQIMHEPPRMETASETILKENKGIKQLSKMEASCDTLQKEGQVACETLKMETSSDFLQKGREVHIPPKVESSKSVKQEGQVHYEIQPEIIQATKRQKLECDMLDPVNVTCIIGEKILPKTNSPSSNCETSLDDKPSSHSQHLETKKHFVIENGESLAKHDDNNIQENKQESFSCNQLNCKDQLSNKNKETVTGKDFGNKIQEKGKQEQLPKKKKGGHVGENYERINYLVQTSRALVNMGEFDKELGSVNFDQTLASQTGSLATAVGRRCLIRLTPSLKRMLCKGCGTALIYGVNARVRHRSNRQKHLVVTCLTCNTIKRFVNDPKHKLWCDQEESLV
ncbi:uncharacterized protein Rpp21 [Macrobrachium rosenbergii]|uniref:uncharacterized protein Rpp21 n=1 Tax=Macrobrachium rosenbergii TaxID=79674 RepID=UPI0034D5A448